MFVKSAVSQRNKKMAAQRSVLFSYYMYLTIKLSRTVANFDIDKNFLKIHTCPIYTNGYDSSNRWSIGTNGTIGTNRKAPSLKVAVCHLGHLDLRTEESRNYHLISCSCLETIKHFSN